MPVIEVDHEAAVRPVDGKKGQNGVVGGEGQELSNVARHNVRPRGGGIRDWLLLGAGEALAVGLVLAPDARNHLLVYLLLFAASSLLALIAARSLSGSRPMFLIICAGVLRLTLLFRPPDLSDDIYRYIWD